MLGIELVLHQTSPSIPPSPHGIPVYAQVILLFIAHTPPHAVKIHFSSQTGGWRDRRQLKETVHTHTQFLKGHYVTEAELWLSNNWGLHNS
jgi:hypothetical protein